MPDVKLSQTETQKDEVPKARRFMTNRETTLKNKLIDLLRDDGKGHHHAAYAKRLALFDINIVPLSVDPNFTAAISFDDGIIYIGEGFLTDPDTFFQLNVILRHELAHNLMMHQIRLINKLGEGKYSKFTKSHSLFDLLNIIADDEISNTRYTEADKDVVRNMFLNGRLIGGLITEDHRPSWLTLPVESLYDAITAELDSLNQQLAGYKNPWRNYDYSRRAISQNVIDRAVIQTVSYKNLDSQSSFNIPIQTIFKTKAYKNAPENIQLIIQNIYNGTQSTEFRQATDISQAFDDILESIANTHPLESIEVLNVTLDTPEEKALAIDLLKKLKSEAEEGNNQPITPPPSDLPPQEIKRSDAYINQYNKIINDYTDNDLDELTSLLNAALEDY